MADYLSKTASNPFISLYQDGEAIKYKKPEVPFFTDGDVKALKNDRFFWASPTVLKACTVIIGSARSPVAKVIDIEKQVLKFHLAALISGVRPGSASLYHVEQHVRGDGKGVLLGKVFPGVDFAFRYRARRMNSVAATFNTFLARSTDFLAGRIIGKYYNRISNTLGGEGPLKKTPSWPEDSNYEAVYSEYLRLVAIARQDVARGPGGLSNA